MNWKLFFKLAAIAGLFVVLMIPLMMIEGQISQRSNRQEDVRREIAQTAAGDQTLVGPVLAIRYWEVESQTVLDGKTKQATTSQYHVEKEMILPATQLSVTGNANVETRYRGLYQAQLFHTNLQVQGKIELPRRLGLDEKTKLVKAHAVLVLGVSDLRGVDKAPVMKLNGENVHFSSPKKEFRIENMPGSQLHVDLGDIDLAIAQKYDFAFPLELTGSGTFSIAPTAENNTVKLRSNWPHPSFQGRFLPRGHMQIDPGFEAEWEISHLARDFEQSLGANGHSGEKLSVNFIEPVNIYLQSERAVKYGSLFIVLTFAAFFLGEILRRRQMHPLQYLLVGLALAIFFLLLVALSEHFSFAKSYLISASACIALITVYLSGVLGGFRPALAFGAGFTGLYGVLYGVLLSEDNALLMGSTLLFIALAAIMLFTRKLDWYRLGSSFSTNSSARVENEN